MKIIYQAYESKGEWKRGIWDYFTWPDEPDVYKVMGVYADSSNPVSRIDIDIEKESYYYICAKIYAPTGEFSFERDAISCALLDQDGNVLPTNLTIPRRLKHNFESYANDYNIIPLDFREGRGFFWMPYSDVTEKVVLGKWYLKEGRYTLEFKGRVNNFLIVEYFYVLPEIKCKGRPIFIPPIHVHQAKGEWIDGSGDVVVMDSKTTNRPLKTSSLSTEVPVNGYYKLFSDVWTAGRFKMGVRYRLENKGEVFEKSISIPEGRALWRVFDLGTFSLKEGELKISFTSGAENPDNPPNEYDLNYKVAVSSFLIIPILDSK
jgi:hypothetical protein